MDKSILSDYIDACELIKETEQDIKDIKKKKKTILQTNVKGSMQEFPYTEQHFHIEGMAYSYIDDVHLREEERLLEERKANAEKIKLQVEEYMNVMPMRIQRIVRLKYFKELSWEKTSEAIGRKTTGDSLRMELDRYMKEK